MQHHGCQVLVNLATGSLRATVLQICTTSRSHVAQYMMMPICISTSHAVTCRPSSISLGIPVLSQQAILQLSDAHSVIELEVAARTAAGCAARTQRQRLCQPHSRKIENGCSEKPFRMSRKTFLDRGDGELRLEDLRAIHNLVERLHDGGPAHKDVVSGDGAVPVLPALASVSM